METEKELREKLGNLVILPDEILTMIIDNLDPVSLAYVAETCRYLQVLSSEQQDKFKIPAVKYFLYIFNDLFKNPLLLENSPARDSLFEFYTKYSSGITVLINRKIVIKEIIKDLTLKNLTSKDPTSEWQLAFDPEIIAISQNVEMIYTALT